MNWKIKALMQRVVAGLPSNLSYAVYYQMQRHMGGLRRINPTNSLRSAVEIVRAAVDNGREVNGARVLEVGAGRRVNIPIAMWLAGADSVTTVDLNPYQRAELIAEDLDYYHANPEEIARIFDGVDVQQDRWDQLMSYSFRVSGLAGLLDMCRINYLAPADASDLDATSHSIDLHISTNVFEHVPRESLVAILAEGGRLLTDCGLAIHRIDHSDHFWHTDSSLTPISFLQYDESTWQRLSGNRYMYANRIRVDDFYDIYRESEQEVVCTEKSTDQSVLDELKRGACELDESFSDKPLEVLATMQSTFVSRPRVPQAVAT